MRTLSKGPMSLAASVALLIVLDPAGAESVARHPYVEKVPTYDVDIHSEEGVRGAVCPFAEGRVPGVPR
jgi:hypothetical protein